MSYSFPSREDTAHTREADQSSNDGGRFFFWAHETGCRWPWAKPFLWGSIVLSASGCLLLLFVAAAFHAPWPSSLWAIVLLLMSGVTASFLVMYQLSLPLFWRFLLVSVALLLWGVDVLLPAGQLTRDLFDVVICLFVFSITLTMLPRLKRVPLL
jgi:hypothetical protein